MSVIKFDITGAAGSFQLCAGHESACEAAIHSMYTIFPVHTGVRIGDNEFEECFVVSDGLVVDAVAGLDFIQKHNCVIDFGEKLLRFTAANLSVGLHDVHAAVDKTPPKTCSLLDWLQFRIPTTIPILFYVTIHIFQSEYAHRGPYLCTNPER